jgi:hypothetical protein
MALPQSFELIANAVHSSVDMQILFAPGGSGRPLAGLTAFLRTKNVVTLIITGSEIPVRAEA